MTQHQVDIVDGTVVVTQEVDGKVEQVQPVDTNLTEAQRAHRQKVLDRIAAQQKEADRVRDAKRAQHVRETAAVAAFAVMCTQTGPGMPWEAFQCDEIEVVAELLRAYGMDAVAERVIAHHADADDQPEDWHHDQWVPIIGSEEASDAA